MIKITFLSFIIALALCLSVNAQYIQNGSTAITVQKEKSTEAAKPDSIKNQKAKTPTSSAHITSTQSYGTFYNGEIVPETIACSLNGSSQVVLFKLGMTRDEVESTIRAAKLPVKKTAKAWTIDKIIIVEYADDGKVSKLTKK